MATAPAAAGHRRLARNRGGRHGIDVRDLRPGRNALGILYHGCDDVADVRGTTALGGGSAKDIEDAILTLPVAVAMRDPEAALMFRNSSPSNRAAFTSRLVAALPEAEDYLDTVAAEAEHEARQNARNAERLLALVRDTRLLSRA
jgi:geranylgeranyl pyrophosphate synthase